MKTIIKKLVFFVFFAALISPLFAQPQPWWLSLEQGKILFRSGNYGEALLLFEDARRSRRAAFEQMERDLINLLSIGEVRRIGDSLERVERYSNDRYHRAASAALEELYYRIPKASLNNSANAALQAIGTLKDYPEAEYWIGEIFRVEGELPLALAQYRKAYALRETLEDTGFATTLQYKISGILRIRQEYNEMERVLHSIINSLDTLWINARSAERDNGQQISYAQASASFASQAMARTLETEGIGRFMELYRYDNGIVEQAHRLLGFHYAATGRPSAQQHLMYAFLIQNTIIIEEIKKRRFDFTFTTLSALVDEIDRNPLLLSYIEEVEYFKTAYYLGASLYRNGRTQVALSFWEFLSLHPQAGEWHNRAVVQLRNPRMEPIVEMP